MNPAVRFSLAALAFFGAFIVAWLLVLVLPLGPLASLGGLVALGAAIIAGRYAWHHADSAPSSVLGYAAAGAVLVGGAGFAGGFFGPMIIAPEANQGPLLGIFITGPIGVVVGAVAGLVFGFSRARRNEQR